jgi:hypothetical protein
MAAQYALRKSTNGQTYFNLLAGNNEVILTSEMYTTKVSAQNGITSVKANSPTDSRYQRLRSSDDKYYFVLRAANQEVIGRSEMYNSQAGMENGISSCKVNGPSAPVVDLT